MTLTRLLRLSAICAVSHLLARNLLQGYGQQGLSLQETPHLRLPQLPHLGKERLRPAVQEHAQRSPGGQSGHHGRVSQHHRGHSHPTEPDAPDSALLLAAEGQESDKSVPDNNGEEDDEPLQVRAPED